MPGGQGADFREVVFKHEGVGLFVSEALAAADDGVGVGGVAEAAVFGEGEEDGFTQAILGFDEGAEPVGEFFREHRNDHADEVGRVTAALGFAVDGGAGMDVGRDVSDVDAYAYFAAVEWLVGKGVVEVLGVVRINCEDDLGAIVEAAWKLGGEHAIGDERGLTFDVGGEFGREIMFEENTEELGAGFVGASEAGGDGAGEGVCAVVPLAEFDDDLVAFLRDGRKAALCGIADGDFVAEARIVGLDDEFAPAFAKVPDDGVAFACEDTDDGADFFAGAAALAAGEFAGKDAIAWEGDAGVLGENLEGGLRVFAEDGVADDEGRAAGAKLNAAEQFAFAELRFGDDFGRTSGCGRSGARGGSGGRGCW